MTESDLVGRALWLGENNDYLAALRIWSDLASSFPNLFYRLMEFECARLLGIESKLQGLTNLAVEEIMKSLPPQQASFLVAETIRRTGKLSNSQFEKISEYFEVIPQSVVSAISQIALGLGKRGQLPRLGLKMVPNRNIRGLTGDELYLYPKKRIRVPKLNIIDSLLPAKSKRFSFVRGSGLVKVIQDVTLIGGSDAVVCNDKFYFDRLSYGDSRVLNPSKDTIISSFTKRKVAICEVPEASLSLDEALWLGYPSTSSWGHFVLECLTRVAMVLVDQPTAALQVIVSCEVPSQFLEMLTYIFPYVTVKRIENGQSVKLQKCLLIPSTVFLPYNFYPAKRDTKMHSSDPSSLALLSKAIHAALNRNNAIDARFPYDIYLSRSAALHRGDQQHGEFESIAQRNGFFVVDPGELNVEDELNLFYHARRIAGFSGSQMLLIASAKTLEDVLILYHDQLSDLSYGSYAFQEATGIRAKYILGRRRNLEPTFSEPSVHQAPLFQTNAFLAFREWIEMTEK